MSNTIERRCIVIDKKFHILLTGVRAYCGKRFDATALQRDVDLDSDMMCKTCAFAITRQRERPMVGKSAKEIADSWGERLSAIEEAGVDPAIWKENE